MGAILYGDLQAEEAFVQHLGTSEGDLINRSVQMSYFGDVDVDLHVHVDQGGDWSRTRAALVERLQEDSVRAERLRLWDALTLLSFASSRGEVVLSDSDAEALAERAAHFARDQSVRGSSVSSALHAALTLRVAPRESSDASSAPWLTW